MRVEKTPKREALFWEKVNKLPGENSCWLWTGAKNCNGYGWITVYTNGKQRFFFVHKVSYEWEYGDIPQGSIVRHTCDTPLCIRPSHLILGTHQDNVNDKMDRGRYVSGVATITEEDAVAIRVKKAAGSTTQELCQEYGFSRQHVDSICRGVYWPNSGGPLTKRFTITALTVLLVLEDLRHLSRSECAKKYGLSESAVGQIAQRKKDHLLKNPIPGTRTITSDRGNLVLVDEQDYDRVKDYSWVEHSSRYSKTTYVSAYIKDQGKRMYMHSFLMGVQKGQRIDHKNGNGLDNRRSENLRFATHQQNMQNSRVKKTNEIGLKGVQKKPSGRFSARIRDADGKRLYLGTFDTSQQAHESYQQAALEHHGEFARII